MEKECICIPGDPCDYHAATCIICFPICQGHPSPMTEKQLDQADYIYKYKGNPQPKS
jgi:hypothetical protein